MWSNFALRRQVLLVVALFAAVVTGVLGWEQRASVRALPCVFSQDKVECLVGHVERYLEREGPDAAMSVFTEFSRNYAPVLAPTAGACHIYAHRVGERAYVLYPNPEEGLRAIGHGFSTCDFGYYHAYLEELFEQRPDTALAATLCETLALDQSDRPAVRNICYQSAGSGFIRALLPRTGAPGIAESSHLAVQPLAACGVAYAGNRDALGACGAGVFGGLMYRVMDARVEPTYTLPQLRRFCEAFEGSAEEVMCRRQVAAALFLVPGFSLDMLIRHSGNYAGADVQRAILIAGLKLFLIESSFQEEPGSLLDQCVARDVQATWCLEGIVQGLFSLRTDKDAHLRVISFCSSDAVRNQGLDRSCYRSAAQAFQSAYAPESAERLCASFPPEFRYLCVSQ